MGLRRFGVVFFWSFQPLLKDQFVQLLSFNDTHLDQTRQCLSYIAIRSSYIDPLFSEPLVVDFLKFVQGIVGYENKQFQEIISTFRVPLSWINYIAEKPKVKQSHDKSHFKPRPLT